MAQHDDLDRLTAALAEHGMGGIDPDEQQLRTLAAAPPGGPLQFVNLLAYHERARYPNGHELAGSGGSGAAAYNRYGMVALDHVTRRGGRLTLFNQVDQIVIGGGDTWDQVAVMEYPDAAAFLDMIVDPDYTRALVHRAAGLARTLVLVTRPLLPVA